MTLHELHTHLTNQKTTEEFQRLFHGRGGLFEEYKHLTIDSIDTIISVAFYAPKEDEEEIIEMVKNFLLSSGHATLIVQRRYDGGARTEVVLGEVPESAVAIENGMYFKLNLLSNQNSGYFPDMKNGRTYVREHAKDKNVLNLFSYTCAFSVAALLGGAKTVVNVDMSKGALSTGKANHTLNALDTRGISFLPYNILKSFSGIRKKGPFDMIIIDPPSFQRGSFEATKDYIKIVQRLDMLSDEDCIVMACLNAPELTSDFIIDLFKEHAPQFVFSHRLENLKEFASIEEEKSLKNLIFIKK
ncbi:MAG: class I SAM-dependent methyltransferase [Sulfurimonadaceae bacterium]|jgi:23S rRNA (cytosine1962-C5)-methyltransferase|nr:class I SAM-dependent methyltransferase [Sulfurimonadaceae bacterium]